MPQPLGSPLPDTSAPARKRDDYQSLLDQLRERRAEVEQGGGQRAVDRAHKRGKMTARERIVALCDEGTAFYEVGTFAGWEMYEDEGGCPSGGVVTGFATVSGRRVLVVANDATVKAGAWFPITGKKNLRAQEIAIENRIPVVYLVDSAGIYLPLQSEIFADANHFGRMFRNNAKLSAMGVPQIAAIMGSCVAGGAYLPIMSDEALIVEGTGSVFLAGPFLVRAAIGETVEEEDLGGAVVHSGISGVTDYRMKDDAECIATIRDLVSHQSPPPPQPFARDASVEPAFSPDELTSVVPTSGSVPYDAHELIARIVDEGSWTPYKDDYGKTIVCGYARVDGWSVGIVANQRLVVQQPRTDGKEMQVGGVIYSESADKAARFVMNCNQKSVPLVFLQDVTGFMVGKRAEHGGIIKDGAKLVSAVSNSVVPKFTIVVGNSYGAGNYAMCGRAYDPRLMLAWPTARIAVMGGAQAAKTLLQIETRKLSKQGKELSESEQQTLLETIQARYDAQTSPYYAAARLWVDEIIEPAQTRDWISLGIELAALNPEIPAFNPGVIQT
jgi:acetyl-CoA carboxylase carboxyltransferase component